MRILIIPTTDWVGHPFPSRLHHVFERISQRHEVHVLRFAFSAEKKLKTRALLHEINEIRTNQLGLYYVVNAPKHYSAIRKIIKENNIDTLVVSNLLAGYMAVRAAEGLAKVVFDLSDYFPASGCGYYFKVDSVPGKAVMFALEKLLSATLKRTEITVACSNPLVDYVKSLGIQKTCLVPNGVDEFFWKQHYDPKEIREKLGLSGYVTIGYIGSIEFWLNIPPLLQAIKSLSKTNEVKLLLIGAKLRTKTAEKTKQMIKDLEIEKNVVWVSNFIPYPVVPNYIAAFDIGVIPFNHMHPTAYYSAPNKLWEYLALQKPVITTPIPDSLSQAGQFLDVAVTSDDYQRIIQSFIDSPEKFVQKAKSASELVQKRSWTTIAKEYQEILQSLH